MGRSAYDFMLLVILNAASWLNPLHLTRPTIYETYYALAKNYSAMGNIPRAKQYYLYTLQGDPRNLSALNDFGVLLLNEGNYSEALMYFKKALEINPRAIKPQQNLNLCQEIIEKNRK